MRTTLDIHVVSGEATIKLVRDGDVLVFSFGEEIELEEGMHVRLISDSEKELPRVGGRFTESN